MSRPVLLESKELTAWLATHPSWRCENDRLVATFVITFNHGLEVLLMVRDNIDEFDHHPRVTLEYRALTIELWTHDRGGITDLDLRIAELIGRAVDVVSK